MGIESSKDLGVKWAAAMTTHSEEVEASVFLYFMDCL